MARRPRPRRQMRMVDVLAMASTASAMSLSNFQLITSSQVPLGCILAYNAPIVGCSTAVDFTQGPQGNVCSSECKRGLQTAESALSAACGGVNVASGSVLGVALSGGLVELLCPSGKPATAAGAAAQNTGSPGSTAAVVITQTTRQIGTFSPIPTPTTLRTTVKTSSPSSSSSSTTDGETSETEAQTSTSSPGVAEPEPTEAAQTTQVAPAPALTSSTSRPTQTTSAQPTKPPPRKTPEVGNPFDVVRVTSGSQQISVRSLEGFLFANIFVFLLLW